MFRDALPDIIKDLQEIPPTGIVPLLFTGFAFEGAESLVCYILLRKRSTEIAFADAWSVTFLGVFANVATLSAGTLPLQSYFLYRRGIDAGSGLGIMASVYVLHKVLQTL